MVYSSVTSLERHVPAAPSVAPVFGHLMPLDSEAHLFCSLLPEGVGTDDIEIMNARFAGRGKNAAWVPVCITEEGFGETLSGLKLFGNLAGLTIHAPYQEIIVRHLDVLSPRGRMAGMADVVRRMPEGRWEGDIAAMPAFKRTLRGEGVDPKGARVWLIGAQGRASAYALSLAEHGVAALTIADERVEAAITLATRVQAAYPGVAVSVGVPDTRSIDIVVDGTSVGGGAGIGPSADPDRFRPETLVVEARARQRMGPFAATCLKSGLSVIAGDCLLIHLLNIYDEFFRWSRIPYKDGSLLAPLVDAA